MDLMDKLNILAEGAKYDAACTSSGSRRGSGGTIGSTMPSGCFHSFSADGRCITLLKVLLSNVCVYDCHYCMNRRSNDLPRTSFKPRELAMQFYRRNYIEGLFLSSAVSANPDHTMEQMIQTCYDPQRRVPVQWLYPRQGDPWRILPFNSEIRVTCGSVLREHRTTFREKPLPFGPG